MCKPILRNPTYKKPIYVKSTRPLLACCGRVNDPPTFLGKIKSLAAIRIYPKHTKLKPDMK